MEMKNPSWSVPVLEGKTKTSLLWVFFVVFFLKTTYISDQVGLKQLLQVFSALS